ncbi:MAG: hypothetical protein COZ70_07105 [Deltaproteobacteria bacterium CG_4_8_14_3_um_filter_51_11]|nr:hypothetical protein [bacterium]OIP38946.1 MAG: hypothetical protein AUK25_11755 [Desulfobacteraceae bacterium CG2_30_51_40]PIP47740.1 MAG: hypothetical protein COX16_03255 [Deltaproteobacteria bacterium CG23_combo_of_CG06-09_8_20_14_all_51_20]PIW01189.1 MAG: hypothetical protein COW41_03230 [Deltaproteobacteria bacterium CG17_big_fil_post_rev_8_21_14_2_50_51_6]PIX19791.1 MAG: hypothetical protein COZ70_07105 [Deltaproteobacteria bacterium CG_4_8_14_3_um_filter_51_11]PIY23658.1 MAG: hypothe
MTEVKYGKWFEDGFSLFKKNAPFLILATLIAVILSAATAGILAGPMIAGMIMITLRLFDGPGEKAELGLLMKGFQFFLDSLLFVFVWGIATIIAGAVVSFFPCVGQLAAIFIAYVAQALLIFGMFLIVDRGMGFWQASAQSYQVARSNFWHFLSFSAIASLIGTVGLVLCAIGVVVTLPIQACILTVAYRDIFSNGRLIEEKSS